MGHIQRGTPWCPLPYLHQEHQGSWFSPPAITAFPVCLTPWDLFQQRRFSPWRFVPGFRSVARPLQHQRDHPLCAVPACGKCRRPPSPVLGETAIWIRGSFCNPRGQIYSTFLSTIPRVKRHHLSTITWYKTMNALSMRSGFLAGAKNKVKYIKMCHFKCSASAVSVCRVFSVSQETDL